MLKCYAHAVEFSSSHSHVPGHSRLNLLIPSTVQQLPGSGCISVAHGLYRYLYRLLDNEII